MFWAHTYKGTICHTDSTEGAELYRSRDFVCDSKLVGGNPY